MTKKIEIVDRGRGPQLSTSRITVQDVVPYLQQNCTYSEIMEIMPVLTVEEIQVIQHYVRDHYEEVMEQDRRIRERNASRVTPPEILKILDEGRALRLALIEQFARKKAKEKNGEAASG
jgi:uncharacterized protein (DUF433 family)